MSKTKQVRVSFIDPDFDNLVASVWVGQVVPGAAKAGAVANRFGGQGSPATPAVSPDTDVDPDETVLVLNHEYPDLRPVPGWLVKGRGLDLVVKLVSGLNIICRGA